MIDAGNCLSQNDLSELLSPKSISMEYLKQGRIAEEFPRFFADGVFRSQR
jgi:hypothetical protein